MWGKLLDVRIISATPTTSASLLGSTVERVGNTIIAFGISTIDILRFGEDQMTTNGTLFKGEVPMTHLLFDLSFDKREEGATGKGKLDLRALGGGRGCRRWTGDKRGVKVIIKRNEDFDQIRLQNRTFNFKDQCGRSALHGTSSTIQEDHSNGATLHFRIRGPT